MLKIVPISFKDACEFVDKYHRHHQKPQGHKFSIAINYNNFLAGVAIVGRPVSRHLDDGITLEVTRLCVDSDKNAKNAASKLYSHCWQIAKLMGYEKIITYTLITESGVSLIASGWQRVAKVVGKSWNTPKRPRVDKTDIVDRWRWEMQ